MTIYISGVSKSIVIILSVSIVICDIVYSTSINYGIHQQPITDINQLMPKLCQNQTMICEGSFCIPGVKKCVCDLRNPVQFGRYCLRQLDIGVQCFVTSQCNHTVKDAICMDGSSEKMLDDKTSRFKLDQWQQLNDLRQQSNMATSINTPRPLSSQIKQNSPPEQHSLQSDSLTDIPTSNLRNSPYEIGYMNPYKQLFMLNNETSQTNLPGRYNIESNRNTQSKSIRLPDNENRKTEILSIGSNSMTSTTKIPAVVTVESKEIEDNTQEKTTKTNQDKIDSQTNMENITIGPSNNDTASPNSNPTSSLAPNTYSGQSGIKKVRPGKWPPGRCSCSTGFTFDQMVRKCLPLSLADARCKSDDDCRHIPYTHCDLSKNKCSCDEHLVWNEQELLCNKEKETIGVKASEEDVTWKSGPQSPKIFTPNITTFVIFSLCVIFGTASILIITYKCFSTKTSSTLITASDRDKRKRRNNKLKSKNNSRPNVKNNHLAGDTKPSSQLSNITKATRGRILNYDFETGNQSPVSSVNPATPNKQLRRSISSLSSDTTVKSLNNLDCEDSIGSDLNRSSDGGVGNASMLPPSPIPSQPHYMMTSALKGASAPSAIAAAAAAAARKRKERQSGHHTDTLSSHKQHDPVFL